MRAAPAPAPLPPPPVALIHPDPALLSSLLSPLFSLSLSLSPSYRSAVDDASTWRRLVARSFPSATLPTPAGAAGSPPSPPPRTCVPPPPAPLRPPPPPPPSRPTWKRLFRFHHTLLYRCLVRGGAAPGRPTVTRLAPGGAFFMALPLAVR